MMCLQYSHLPIILQFVTTHAMLIYLLFDEFSSAGLLKTYPPGATRNNRGHDGMAVETTSSPLISLQNSPLSAAQATLDKVLRRNGADSNSATAEGSRNSSNISIRFSKKAADDSEDELAAVLAIKKLPPAEPMSMDVEVNETV